MEYKILESEKTLRCKECKSEFAESDKAIKDRNGLFCGEECLLKYSIFNGVHCRPFEMVEIKYIDSGRKAGK
jgi:hypothetical protein